MRSAVQVTPGANAVGRFGDVVVWFETDPSGGGVMVTHVLQILRAVAAGSVAPHQMGARLAAVLTTGDHTAVPALVAAVPLQDGLQVVVHGWGAVAADGIRVTQGWVDEVLTGRLSWWIGRNTANPVPPSPRSVVELVEGLVPGDGAAIAVDPPPSAPALAQQPVEVQPELPEMHPADLDPPVRIVVDDGRTIELTTGFVLGTNPEGSRAVRQGLLQALVIDDPAGTVRPVHAELRVDGGRVAIVDATDGATHVLAPGADGWTLVPQGQVLKLQAGTRVAVGTRILLFQGR